MDDLFDPSKCHKQPVLSTDAYTVDLLKFGLNNTREFMVACVTTKRNCKKKEVEEMFKAVTEFVKNTPEANPCYVLIDVAKTDAFTLEQLKYAAASFKAVRPFLVTRLVGTMVKISEDSYQDSYLSKAFRKLYTPVRPVCWWRKPDDFKDFVNKWEAEFS